MDPKLSKNEFYKTLFKTFDKSLMASIEKSKGKITLALERNESRLRHCEDAIREASNHLVQKCKSELKFADILVNKEMRSKILMSDWTGKFLSESCQDSLDPVTFAFTRYSLNICVAFTEVTPRHLLDSNVHRQLVDYLSYPSDLVTGPALMGLVHISLYPELKPHIILVGVLPSLVRIMAKSTSKAVLCQGCKLLASLALHHPNKSPILNSGCLHAILDLILGSGRDIDDHIQSAALTAVVNITNGHDATRTLMVELSGIKPTITAIQTSTNSICLIRGVMVLANVAYCNSFTAGKILSEGGHLVLLELLQTADILRQQADVARAALVALYNLCNNNTTQTFVGCAPGLCEAAVRICDNARDPLLVAEAATLLLAIMWDNQANKARVAAKNACTTLIKRIIRHSTETDDVNLHCLERLSYALASMLMIDSHHDQMHAIGGLDEIVRICRKSSHDRILRALGQVLSAMVPSPDSLLRAHEDSYTPPIEKVHALDVFKKIKFTGFAQFPTLPEWIQKPLCVLAMDDEALRQQPIWIKSEFIDKMTYAKEFVLAVEPDADILRDVNCRGLILSSF